MSLKEFVRKNCPNVPCLKKAIAMVEMRKLKHHLISEEDQLRGEDDLMARAEIVKRCSAQWPTYTAKAEAVIQDIFQRAPEYQGRSDLETVRSDMLFCRFAYGFQPDEYLYLDLEKKVPQQRREFVSDLERIRYQYQLNDFSDSSILKDKAETYRYFQPYFHREVVQINKMADYGCFERFVHKHPIFVKKAVYESCGRSVERIDIQALKCSPRELFESLIAQGKHVLEECVVQAPSLAAFNTSSVNTVRCITLYTNRGVLTPYCFIRTGQKGAFVDNGGAGGILSGIDSETGCLVTDGIDELNQMYLCHPDSKVPFKGFQLPQWDKLLALCKEMALKIPSVKFIGWDLAFTSEHGWILIEGNPGSQLIGPQMTFKRGIKAEFESYMREMDIIIG